MDEDGLLLRRFVKDRSQPAFEALVRRHVDMVYGVGLRMTRNPHRAEDITQTVFTELSRKARSLCDRKSLGGWLCLSAVYASKHLVRTETRRSAREQAVDFLDLAPEPSVDSAVLEPILDGALERLKTADREAVVLRFFKNLSFAEVGTCLGVSENAARMRVQRGIERLRGILSLRGIVSTATAIELAMQAQAAVAAPARLALQIVSGGLVATASGSALAGVLSFMSATKIILTGCSVALLAALVGYYHEHKLRLSDEMAIVALQQKEATNEQSDKAQIAQLRQSLSAMTARTRRGDLQAANSKAGSRTTLSMEDLVKEHPELRPLYNRMVRRSTIMMYGSALRSLSLSADKLTQLEGLLVDLRISQNDAREAALTAGLQPGAPGFGDAIRQAQGADRQQIVALIGDEAWVQLQKAPFTNGYQTQIDSSYAPALQASGVPLSNDQSQALAQTMYDVLMPTANAAARDPGFREVDPQTWLSPSDQELISRASQVLSAEQVTAMKQSISDDNQIHSIMGSARLIMH